MLYVNLTMSDEQVPVAGAVQAKQLKQFFSRFHRLSQAQLLPAQLIQKSTLTGKISLAFLRLFSRFMACSPGSTYSPVFISVLAMLLVRYPFASILPIVFPFPMVSFEFARFYISAGLRAVYTFACFAYQTQGLCSAFPRSPFQFVRFCLSRIVLRTSPHQRLVCAMLFLRSPLKFVRLCLSYYVIRTSPHKHRVCEVLFPRFPCEFVRLCVSFRYAYFASQTSGLCSACTSVPFGILHACAFMFCVLCLTNIGFVQCFSLGSLLKSLYAVSHVLFCVFSLTHMGFVQCLCLGPLLSLYAYLCRVMLCVHQFRAVLFSRLPFKFTRLHWSCFVKTVKFVCAFIKHFETL